MLTYIIKTIACSLLFWLLYRVVFEQERMHRFNRLYLMAALAASLAIPLVSFTVEAPVVEIPAIETVVARILSPANIADTVAEATEATEAATENVNHTALMLWSIYIAVAGVLLARFVANLARIRTNIRKGEVRDFRGVRLVQTSPETIPHTFMNRIFIPAGVLPEEEILSHELAHARQRHSIDKLVLELLRIVLWFNPALALYRRSIDLNHEYLADEAVLHTHHNVVRYQTLLIRDSTGLAGHGIVSNFNPFYNTKKRLIMMTKTTSRGKALAKQLTIVPLCALALALFANRVAASGTASETTRTENTVQQPATATGATSAQLDEYKTIVAKGSYTKKFANTDKPVSGIDMSKYSAADMNRMMELYAIMSEEQQKQQDVAVFRSIQIPVEHPSASEFESLVNEKAREVWLDDKNISGSELSKYKPSDIGRYGIMYVGEDTGVEITDDILRRHGRFQLYTVDWVNKRNAKLKDAIVMKPTDTGKPSVSDYEPDANAHIGNYMSIFKSGLMR